MAPIAELQDVTIAPAAQAVIDAAHAANESVLTGAKDRRPFSQWNASVRESQARRRGEVVKHAREMQLRGEKESAVAAYLAVRLLEIEQLSECVCGLVLIGNEDCPRCEVTGPVED
jgi:hypothetical protein